MPFRLLLLHLSLLPLLLSAAPADDTFTPEQLPRVTPLVRLVREVGPAVVNIYQEVYHEVELRWPYNRIYGPLRTRQSSLGSGVVIDPDGYILTNAHVIDSDVPQNIQVRLDDGSSHTAQLVNTDPANDVALLKISPDRPLRAARLGRSSDVMVGESVVAIGNPLNNENTVTAGIVSSVFREVKVPGGEGRFRDFIQIDAPINPGNSGGPLLNVLGEVIGINWAIATGAEGIGFAIPIDRVRESLLGTLLNPVVLGGVDAGVEVAGGPDAVQLADVRADSPAARAGLRPGDELVSIGGVPVRWEFDVNKVLYRTAPGERIEVVVRRGERLIPAELTIERIETALAAIRRVLGLRVVDHPTFFGVLVESVDPAGPAAAVPLQRGDLIDGLDDVEVDGVEQFHRLLRQVPSGGRLRLHLFRNGQPLVGTLQRG